MSDLIIALIGILIPIIIAYAVYIYRPQIGFQLHCAKASFRAEDEKVVHAIFPSGVQVEIGKITLVNDTRADIDDFEISYELRASEAQLIVLETKNLAKSAIGFSQKDEEISISLSRFPAKEKVVIGYSILGSMWGLDYSKPKKKSGKFNLYSIQSRSEFLRSIFIGGFVGFLISLVPAFISIVVFLQMKGEQ